MLYTPPRLSSWPPALLIVLMIALPVSAQPATDSAGAAPASPRALDKLNARVGWGSTNFRVQDPQAAASVAWIDDARMMGKRGETLRATAEYELTSRVIVQAEQPELLYKLAREHNNVAVNPARAVRGYWVLRAASVAEAAAIADELADCAGVYEVSLDVQRPRVLRAVPDDPYFNQQWHLHNELNPVFDVNAEAAWDLGYTGAGIVIGIVEDAWDHQHFDLAPNYCAEATQEGGAVTAHATACAGLAGEVAYNGIQGAALAYGARISGQRYGTDLEIAEALTYRNDLNDIKSNSWGPIDDAMIDLMPAVVRSAIEESIANGRGGLGEIFVWAAGNGGAAFDRVEYDPYASSRYTIAVGAIGDQDWRPTYSEVGSSLMLVAQSSGNVREIATTGRYNSWTTHFGGTSASAPLVAGVVALMLEANPTLTWRDVQHVLIESARKCDPDDPGWITNGAGYDVSYDYGFGAADAGVAVALAETWVNVSYEVPIETHIDVNLPIPDGDPNGVMVTVDIADDLQIESVELIPRVDTTYIGDLEIVLTGPTGTPSLLARQRNDPRDNYTDYAFTSLRHWGESSAGQWSVRIADLAADDAATWVSFQLMIYGRPPCVGDLTTDGAIGLDDIMVLLEAYGTYEGDAAFNAWADFDNNKHISLSDLAFLLSRFGESCE